MRVAVIVPRYGAGIAGGAESQARGFVFEAARRGWTVEVWTTCALNHYTWENSLPAGVERDGNIMVRRFPVTQWDAACRADLETRLAAQGTLPVDEEYRWVEAGAHSAELYAHADAHGASFDVIVALPYAMPLTHYAASACGGRVVLWPCLHNEPYAYMEPSRLLLENSWGVMFNSPEEAALAVDRIGIQPRRWGVLGEGVTLCRGSVEERGGKPRTKNERFLLYVGRLEEGKNLAVLYDYVRRYWDDRRRMQLIILGSGPYLPPRHPAFDDKGFVGEIEKARFYASALALCQPSLRESFSLTIMESWLAGRPVLVHGDCPVTVGHVRRSRGGLWFGNYEEFAGTLDWLAAHADLAARMGRNGCTYVETNYRWASVVDRFERMIHKWRRLEDVTTNG